MLTNVWRQSTLHLALIHLWILVLIESKDKDSPQVSPDDIWIQKMVFAILTPHRNRPLINLACVV